MIQIKKIVMRLLGYVFVIFLSLCICDTSPFQIISHRLLFIIIIIIIIMMIIITKNGRQCEGWEGVILPYQSKNPSFTIQTHRKKEGKTVENKKAASS